MYDTFIHLGTIPACNGQTDGIAVANTVLCIASNAAALLNISYNVRPKSV